jgi:hypothetical protein
MQEMPMLPPEARYTREDIETEQKRLLADALAVGGLDSIST